MKLYFSPGDGKRIQLIAKVADEEEAFKEIHGFCEERSYKVHYVRSWIENDVKICQPPHG
jgi:hypothetical protein